MREVNNELYLGNIRLSELVKDHPTPLYVYDEAGIEHKISQFRTHFTSKQFFCETIYASKAFLAPYLCQMLEKAGFGIDAVSLGDLYLIKKSGFPLAKVVFHGNNKSDEELQTAIKERVGLIVVDNLNELKRLMTFAEAVDYPIKTLFRVNPGISAHTHAYIETALLSSKFGESIYDWDKMHSLAKLYQESRNVKLLGFHAHIGSQINTPSSFVKSAQTMLNFMAKFQEETKMVLNTLNLGGGFGIKYLPKDKEIKLPEMLTKIVKTVEKGVKEKGLALRTLMIEPGRSLVGDSGFTLYRCGGTKQTFGHKNYVFIDGGMADNIRPALYQAKYTVGVANRFNQPLSNQALSYDIVGKCCESGDVIAKDVVLEQVEEGDTIIVFATGAYCYSMSMNYNGLTRGEVVFIKDDQIKVVIEKESLDQLVSTCVFGG
ncbi:MAG TPA: diaminopimelate decarboxylase [Bacilli bacterium]|nr:diaminopimelate decarboxylase [Bacilli bacterium]HPX84200.1 diaminopimelate decarboxylase [Bacilli bacterium]HQC74159.1 diaminopimelate decarboxylase [Bacilli bacterium]